MTTLTIACAVGAATTAGAFFTFSDFTIAGLRRLPPARGAGAMQAINKEAPSPPFMLLLFGTAAACLVLMVHAGWHLDAPGATIRLVAGGTYIAGVVLTTIGYHVPRNNRLDRIDPNITVGADYWAVYLKEWVRMNHVRTIAPWVTAVLLMVSLTMG